MKKFVKYLIAALLIILIYVAYLEYPRLNIITGFASKNMTSVIFLGHRSKESVEKGENGFSPINAARYKVDQVNRKVTATIYGLNKRTAVYFEGLGAILINKDFDENEPRLVPNRNRTPLELPYPYGYLGQKDTVFGEVDYQKLTLAVSNAFDERGEQLQKTRSVLVVYKDQIIAEQYADGFDSTSLMHGWSMAKSITGTVYGRLERLGKIDINKTTGLTEWEHDARKDITYSNLLQMNSGLAWEEDYFKISDVTKMLYLESNMGHSQIDKPLVGTPGKSWNYSSGTTNLLAGPLLRSQFSNYQDYLDFWYTELLDKIGMHSALIETDIAGNYVGSSYAWATTRDWAKLGLLYMHKGNWNGEQVLDSTWINYTSTPTNTSEGTYGAQFYLNAEGYFPNVPRDLFYCSGFQGQFVFIIPSRGLTIVRMGLKGEQDFDIDRFLKQVIASVN
jgi:CubicO group peptidase (beta-lactamase class C family)